MVAINFERRFVDAVVGGKKRQTVRRERKGRPIVAGDKLQLYTGLRTKGARKLADAVCTETAAVEIDRGDLFLGGRFADAHDREGFAQADGFESYDAMASWFASKAGLPFRGRVIRWRVVG